MGAWGTYPKDSEGALDLFGKVSQLINERFDSISQGFSDYNYAGAVMLLLQKGFSVNREIVRKAKHCVEKTMSDTLNGNKCGWKEPEKAIKSMKQVIEGFDKIISGDDNETILAPINWLQREGEKDKANWSGLGFVE